MRDAGQQRVRALTLSFAEFVGTQEDETPLASQVAAHYGAEHIVRKVTQSELQADLPNIMLAMDQPSIDGINSWFISKAAKEVGLKVVLSGTGGDELLAGYSSFIEVPNWVKLMRGPSLIPGAAAASRFLARLSGIGVASPKSLGFVEFSGTYEGSYLLRRGLFLPRELQGFLPPDVLTLGLKRLGLLKRISSSLQPDPGSAIGRVCAMESANYLRNQLLRDADWASMAHSVELRTPFVDSVLLNQMAPYMPKIRALGGKATLGGSPSRPLPEEVLVRRKAGFVVPLSKWSHMEAKNFAANAANKGQASRQWALKVMAAQATDAEGKAQIIKQSPIQV
jgi:asparagine synthase (glutamine-hydrolysing)